jgi:hypothetical protein
VSDHRENDSGQLSKEGARAYAAVQRKLFRRLTLCEAMEQMPGSVLVSPTPVEPRGAYRVEKCPAGSCYWLIPTKGKALHFTGAVPGGES